MEQATPGASPRPSTGDLAPGKPLKNLVEQGGIDYLPDHERKSNPLNLFFVFFGSQMSLGIIVIGILPITFGLGLWDSFTSITVGTAIGALIFCPAVMLGVKSGTCSPAGSVAHFGVRGRLIGSSLTLMVAIGFFALTVWTGGDALVSGIARYYHTEVGNNVRAIGAAIICASTLATAYFGHEAIVASEKAISVIVLLILAAAIIAFLPGYNWHYAGSTLVLGSFWPTWFLAVSVSAVVPISYAGFEGDYSRHIPQKTDPKKLVLATGLGIFAGCWVALMFAAFTGVLLADPNAPYVQGLVARSPGWLVGLLVVAGILGSQPQGSLCIYHAGLASQVFGVRLSRPAATILLGALCLGVVFVGIYLVDMTDMMLAFMTIMAVAVTPWLIINLVGHYFFSDEYDPYDLFAYLRPGGRGRYWYQGGWNWRAALAWSAGVIAGLLFTHSSLIEGPLSNSFGGVTLDYVVAALLSGGLYYGLEKTGGLGSSAASSYKH